MAHKSVYNKLLMIWLQILNIVYNNMSTSDSIINNNSNKSSHKSLTENQLTPEEAKHLLSVMMRAKVSHSEIGLCHLSII